MKLPILFEKDSGNEPNEMSLNFHSNLMWTVTFYCNLFAIENEVHFSYILWATKNEKPIKLDQTYLKQSR